MRSRAVQTMQTYYRQQESTGKHQIYLYDDISEKGEFDFSTWTYGESKTSANYIREILEGIPETAEIEIFINSNGGSVKEGVAIFNQLARHKAKKTGYVDGVAHSIAFVILQACDHRVMGEGTSALIHEMWICCCGNADELRKEADQLDVLMRSNRKLFMKRAKGITEEELQAMMKEERILTPEEALEMGFCDEIKEISGNKKAVEDIQQNIRCLKEQFQKGVQFAEELQAFEEQTKEAEQKETEQKEEEEDALSAFFKAFL